MNRNKEALNETEYKWKKREFTEAVVSNFSCVFNQIAYIGVFILGGYLMITGSLRLSVVAAITNLAQCQNVALYEDIDETAVMDAIFCYALLPPFEPP